MVSLYSKTAIVSFASQMELRFILKKMHFDGNAADVFLDQIFELPKACERPPTDIPLTNYAIFWQTFSENYPFFKLHGVDWRAVGTIYRGQVGPNTKSEGLFTVFRQMIEPLHDSHTGFEASDLNRYFDGIRPDPSSLERAQWEQAVGIIRSKYVLDLISYCGGHVQFGTLSRSIGYLRIDGFYGYVENESYLSNLQALQAALDAIIQKAKGLQAIVIDVRQNNGGDDPLAIEIASRLTATKYLAYKKIARNNPTGRPHFTPPQDVWVAPGVRPAFRGKIVLLIGPDTVSAGETFAMALMSREPHVVRIGLDTQGVFSDILVRHLPNGWRFRLPNEIYLTDRGKAFDGTGIPPEIRMSFFSSGDLKSGRDAALQRALDLLNSSGN
jgi:Peptidase family S41/Tricorn protease C1 domain